jgi:cyclic pyranopterin phosphate synthase
MMPPVSLRISVTDRCSLRCLYCAPSGRAAKYRGEKMLTFEEIAEFARLVAARYGLTKIRITGGEPLIRPGIEDLVRMLANAGAPVLALTTDGQRLAAMAELLKQAGLHRVNISLDSLQPAAYAAITGGGVLAKTLEGIEEARRAGLDPIKLNMVVLRGMNQQEPPGLVRFAMEHGCQARFLELMPIGEAASRFDSLFVPSSEVRAKLESEFRLTAREMAFQNTSRDFVAEDRDGRKAVVGFISPSSEPFCGGCRRLRLTSTGTLIGCLARDEAIPLAPLLRQAGGQDTEGLVAALERALATKRQDGRFEQPRRMVGIGG